MSNASGSSVTSNSRERRKVVGLPKRCWCGEATMAIISKSDSNPYRRYYRCVFAASKKLSNDNHIFKWHDEALVDEIETLTLQLERLEESAKQLILQKIEQMKNDIVDGVNEGLCVAIAESEYKMKKLLAIAVVSISIIIVILKLVG